MMSASKLPVGQYIPGDSLVHRLDPRTKLLALVLLVTAVFVYHTWSGLLAVTLLGLLAVLAAGISPASIWPSLKPITWLLVIGFLFHAFLTPKDIIWSWGILHLSGRGALAGAYVSWRLLFLVGMSIIMTLTTSPLDLTEGIERLLKPFSRFGLPAHELAMMMTIAMRFIPALAEEAGKISRAQVARGADFSRGRIWERVGQVMPLIIPLFVGAFRRADELAIAMEARCYRGGQGRTRYRQLVFSGRDGLVLVLVLIFAVAAFWLPWGPVDLSS